MADSPLIIKSKEFALQIIKVCAPANITKDFMKKYFDDWNKNTTKISWVAIKQKEIFGQGYR